MSEVNGVEVGPDAKVADLEVGDLIVQRLSMESDGRTFLKFTGYMPNSNKPKPIIELTRGKPFFYDGENIDVKNYVRWTRNKERLYVTMNVTLYSRPESEIVMPAGSVVTRISDITGGPRNSLTIRHIYKI